MKIAMVIEEFDLQKGGQERSTFEIAELLAAKGMDVTLVTAESAGLPAGAKSKLIDFEIEHPSRAKRYMKFVQATNDYFQKNRFEIIHAITPVPCANVYQPRGGLAQEIFNRNLARYTGLRRMLRKWFGLNPRMKEIERMERFLATETRCTFLAVSDYVQRQCMEHLGLPADRTRVIFNGVDLQRLPAAKNEEERNHLRTVMGIGPKELAGVFIATNFKLKGLDVLIEAARLLREKHAEALSRFRFIISGPDKNRRYFEKVQRLGLAERILFLGPSGEIGSLYNLADFLIHPTWYDPCSRVVLEAMACGVPAISTKYNGASELLTKRNCGLVLDEPADAGALMDAFLTMLNEDQRTEFARNGLSARKEISMDRHVEELIKFYHENLQRKTAGNQKVKTAG
jgi:UDP-glucose:(heptosyl)LPS alpha-1,3-glucosyltransferase